MANKITDYTEEQFIHLLQEIFTSNGDGTPEMVLADLLDKFCELAEHPAGTDLIYWPEDDADCTPEGITETVKKWRATNELPGFKQ
ncbi:bacteriocin immunity protein [Pseudomonas fluorescens]|uniref:bacteriocin immunity protein n=1 Tax=Pseudomonas fluorescens TaxID=294 RepID=UPI001CA68AFF|nr:bacteriocin immunity protein [Pseudomonas fluorescens]MBY8936848.1 bacteriocin immunity protein [Pseudomonas fluorescens]